MQFLCCLLSKFNPLACICVNDGVCMCNLLKFACVTAGGFSSNLLALNRKTYEQAGVDTEGNTPGSIKDPGIGWMTAFLFVTSFVGLLALVPIRKVFLISIEFYGFSLPFIGHN